MLFPMGAMLQAQAEGQIQSNDLLHSCPVWGGRLSRRFRGGAVQHGGRGPLRGKLALSRPRSANGNDRSPYTSALETFPQVSNAAPPTHHGERRSGGVAFCCGHAVTSGVRLVVFVAVDPESSVVSESL